MFYISRMRNLARMYNETLKFIKYLKRKIKLAYEFDTSIILPLGQNVDARTMI